MEQPPYSLDYLRQVLADYFTGKPVGRVQVFGSYARGEATAASDLDLLIDLEHLVGWEWLRHPTDLAERLGSKVDMGTAVSDHIMRYNGRDLQTIYESAQKAAA